MLKKRSDRLGMTNCLLWILKVEPDMTFSWKEQKVKAERKLKKRIAIEEKCGNQQCYVRDKRRLERMLKNHASA